MEKRMNIRTDMAMETAEALLREQDTDEISGVESRTEELGKGGKIRLTTVKITNRSGEKKMGKPMGSYVTIESKAMRENDVARHEEIAKILASVLVELRKIGKNSVVLIVGLGNWNVTPDALGPKVVSKALVTRHIMEQLPGELEGATRPVGAFSPGVLGITGIETAEMVRGVVDRVRPELVIAVDALAARNVKRVNASIQLSDTGIHPGSGMGNNRLALNEKTLGVPVIGIGVPTVVDAATLINDTMDLMLSQMMDELPESSEFLKMLAELEEHEKYGIIRGILEPHEENMFVAPKESDAVVEHLSNIIANALNIALHPGISAEDMNRYIY